MSNSKKILKIFFAGASRPVVGSVESSLRLKRIKFTSDYSIRKSDFADKIKKAFPSVILISSNSINAVYFSKLARKHHPKIPMIFFPTMPKHLGKRSAKLSGNL